MTGAINLMSQGKKRLTANIEDIRALAQLLDEAGLTELEYRYDSVHIRLSKQGRSHPLPAFGANSPAPLEENGSLVTARAHASPIVSRLENLADHAGVVKSPMVGIVYLSPEPNAPPFVSVGDIVNIGDTLVLIEAMKVFNPFKSPVSGKVARVLVGHGVPVEFGEPLMVIE